MVSLIKTVSVIFVTVGYASIDMWHQPFIHYYCDENEYFNTSIVLLGCIGAIPIGGSRSFYTTCKTDADAYTVFNQLSTYCTGQQTHKRALSIRNEKIFSWIQLTAIAIFNTYCEIRVGPANFEGNAKLIRNRIKPVISFASIVFWH